MLPRYRAFNPSLCIVPQWICSPVLYSINTSFPLSCVVQCLIAARGSFGVILYSLSLFPLSSSRCHPVHQPPPDNDVLIMRLLGQQIALQSHSHAVENCCCLGAPTPLRASGRLTLASCWEWRSGTRAGAPSLSPRLLCSRGSGGCSMPPGALVCVFDTTGWCQTIRYCVSDIYVYSHWK